ncbi:MAG TPA: glycerate kinase, partial [Roseivirga sp.]
LSDVQNPLTGTKGASYVFGKQKGASESEIEQLDMGLENLAAVLASGKKNLPGAGAAGGLGYGLMTFLGAELKSGIEQVMELIDYASAVQNVDLIITGEGKLDSQTLGGKVITGVIQQGRLNNIPIGILCGVAENVEQLKSSLGTSWIFQVRDKAKSFQDSMLNANQYLEVLAREFLQQYSSI